MDCNCKRWMRYICQALAIVLVTLTLVKRSLMLEHGEQNLCKCFQTTMIIIKYKQTKTVHNAIRSHKSETDNAQNQSLDITQKEWLKSDLSNTIKSA